MKKLVLIVLALICLLTAVGMVIPVSAASSYIRGDADGDGHVTIMDVTCIQKKLAEIPTPSFDERAADVDGDGLNITDATQIQRYLAEYENTFKIGETVIYDEYELPFIPVK
ncbi:MAG: dockerin type I repeat-containing protein [Ruminococcus sp.]|nr:dockerin type I repeat-containing protein [Ruminococcus sp.]